MKAGRIFNPGAILEEARSGRLTGAALQKAIKTAEEFGNTQVSDQLKLCVVHSASFAGDAAPAEVRQRVAQGISALTAMGEPLSRTKQMLRRHGVIDTINRIAKYPAATKNFDRLCAAGKMHLTAEAIVLDYPQLFDPAAGAIAKRRLAR